MFTIEKIEYRPAKEGDWFWDRFFDKPVKAENNCTDSMIILIGYEPEKFVPKGRRDYYVPGITDEKLYDSYCWEGDETNDIHFERGLCYPYTEEGKQQAIEHAKRMLEV